MATIKSSGDLLASIAADLSDNNAGLISAEDVRHNMADTVSSINHIVASGNTDTKWPFFQNVRVKHDLVSGEGGIVYAESGIIFPNSTVDQTGRQQEPFLGIGNLNHNALANLTSADPHTQYVSISGFEAGRVMTGNLGMGTSWVGASGDATGLKFAKNAAGTDDISVSGEFVFKEDNSTMSSAHGVAKAWMNWSAVGGNITVNSYHNINAIAAVDSGVFQVTFTSGTFLNNNYTAVGVSNGISSTGTYDAMQPNSVGLTLRNGDDSASLRSMHFKVEQDDGDAVFAGHNDLVVYGYNLGSTSGVGPTVTNYSP
tara:strand:+ start:110 stop:1051 length:942 start_codon:yes stop_codon:yes gene_type:complete